MPIAALIREAAARFGPAVALEDASTTRGFDALAERIPRLAAGLLGSGLRPCDPVLVLTPNTVAAVESDLACAVAGLVRVPLNPRLGAREWTRIRRDCGAGALIVDTSVPGADHFAAEFTTRAGDVLVTTRPTPAGAEIDQLVAAFAPLPATRALPSEALCALHYSSGTTGVPKGAQRTYGNRMASLHAMRAHVLAETIDADTVFAHAGPVIHTSGLFVLPMLAAGARQLLLDHPRPARLAALAGERPITHTALVPTVIARLLELDDDALAPLRRNLRMLAYAGAPMPVEHIRRAYRRITPHLVQYYGMVEAIPPLTVLTPADHHHGVHHDPDLLTTIGRPVAGVRLDLLDENGDPVPTGEIGELTIAGTAVSPGYHNADGRDDLGKAHRAGRLSTGDLGRCRLDGAIELTGRRSDMIITGGYNVYPREIERVLTAVPGVRDAVAVGVPDPVWGQRIIAGYLCHEGQAVSEDAIRDAATALADYKRPKSAIRLDRLPVTALGKIDRAAATTILTRTASA